ncbi:MAG TPA: hypothetical protein VFN25_04685, partial [Dokdonella sp.]|uniref:hypothetical protein n=1 Tax=Dokdonella sp. TaxID=2291710 RepID=UPI002D7FCD6A
LINAMRLHGREAEARTLIPALREDLERYPVRAENKAASYTFMALVESDTGRALELHRKSYDVLAEHLGPNEPTVIRRLANVAGATLADGDIGAALQGYAEAMRRVSERGELESDYFITPQGVYGRLLTAHGRWDEAKVWLDRAVRLQAVARGTHSPLYLYVRGDLLLWEIEREPSDELLDQLDQWLAMNEELVGKHHARTRYAWRLRTLLLRRLDRSDEAYTQWLEQQAKPWEASPQQAAIDAQWQADGAALLLDLERVDEACEHMAGVDRGALPEAPSVEGLSVALDLALCASRSGNASANNYALRRAELVRDLGAADWRLKRRPTDIAVGTGTAEATDPEA